MTLKITVLALALLFNSNACLAAPTDFDLMQQKRYDEALLLLNKRCAEYPQYSGPWKMRGECNYFLAKYDDAIRDFTHAISVSKKPNWDLFRWRYASYLKVGQFVNALTDCEKVLELSPMNIHARNDIIAIAKRIPQNKRAQQVLNNLGDIFPEVAVEKLMQQAKYREAAALASRVLKKPLSPDRRIQLLADRAHCYVSMSDLKSALNDYNHLIRIHPHPPFGLFLSRAELLGSFGMNHEAAADVTQVINRKMTFSNLRVTTDDLYFRRAGYYLKAGEFRKAAADYDAILKMDPTQEEAYKLRGDCNTALKNYELALKDYSKAIENDAESAGSSYYARSLVYQKMGKPKEAQSDRKRALELGYVPRAAGGQSTAVTKR